MCRRVGKLNSGLEARASWRYAHIVFLEVLSFEETAGENWLPLRVIRIRSFESVVLRPMTSVFC